MIARASMTEEFFHHHLHGRTSAREINLFDPCFAMDTEAQFRLPRADAIFLGGTGDRACVQRHADGDRAVNDAAGGGCDGVKIGPGLGHGPGDFVDEERACHATCLRQIRKSDVIVDDDHRYLQPEGAGALSREAEVETVARVVLDDQQTARLARDRQNARQHGVDRGRGEHIAADGGGQHPLPHKARMAGFMARAAP